jgi:hypothetical protein
MRSGKSFRGVGEPVDRHVRNVLRPTMSDQPALGEHEISRARDAEIRRPVTDQQSVPARRLRLVGARAFAGATGGAAHRTGIRKRQPPLALAGRFEPVRRGRQPIQAVTREDRANRVIQAVAEYLDGRASTYCHLCEIRERRIDNAFGQVRIEFGPAHVEQCYLSGHAVARTNASRAPSSLEHFPARAREALEQRVGGVIQRNRAVEIAKYRPVGHKLSFQNKLVGNLLIRSRSGGCNRRTHCRCESLRIPSKPGATLNLRLA